MFIDRSYDIFLNFNPQAIMIKCADKAKPRGIIFLVRSFIYSISNDGKKYGR